MQKWPCKVNSNSNTTSKVPQCNREDGAATSRTSRAHLLDTTNSRVVIKDKADGDETKHEDLGMRVQHYLHEDDGRR